MSVEIPIGGASAVDRGADALITKATEMTDDGLLVEDLVENARHVEPRAGIFLGSVEKRLGAAPFVGPVLCLLPLVAISLLGTSIDSLPQCLRWSRSELARCSPDRR